MEEINTPKSEPLPINLATITDGQVEFFQENGYIQIDGVLSPDEVIDLRSSVEEATGRQQSFHRRHEQFDQYANLWTIHEEVRRHVLNPRMAEFARRLSRSSRIRIWSDQLLVKMPGGRPSYWHQDVPLWAMIESGALSCWMALVDVTASMGCMRFIPGSHRWGRFAWKTLPGDLLETLDGLRLLLPEDKHSRLQPVEVPLKAGSCTFHDGLMMHYAGPNLTDRARLGLVTHYVPDGTTFSGINSSFMTDAANLVAGQPIEGDLFPVVASEGTD